MKKLPILFALASLTCAPAFAEDASPIAFNAALTSNYVFRGVSQSQNDFAVSGGVDYAHASGAYLGAWASTQKWVETGPAKLDSNIELDLYGGYKGAMGEIAYDLGFIRYVYNGDRSGAGMGLPSPDTTELYVGASYGIASVKYSRAISTYFVGWGGSGEMPSTKGSGYLELNLTQDLGDGWGLTGHLGHQKVKNVSAASYTDWKLGVTKDLGFGVVSVAYSDTDAKQATYTFAGEKVADGILAVSLSKAF